MAASCLRKLWFFTSFYTCTFFVLELLALGTDEGWVLVPLLSALTYLLLLLVMFAAFSLHSEFWLRLFAESW